MVGVRCAGLGSSNLQNQKRIAPCKRTSRHGCFLTPPSSQRKRKRDGTSSSRHINLQLSPRRTKATFLTDLWLFNRDLQDHLYLRRQTSSDVNEKEVRQHTCKIHIALLLHYHHLRYLSSHLAVPCTCTWWIPVFLQKTSPSCSVVARWARRNLDDHSTSHNSTTPLLLDILDCRYFELRLLAEEEMTR